MPTYHPQQHAEKETEIGIGYNLAMLLFKNIGHKFKDFVYLYTKMPIV